MKSSTSKIAVVTGGNSGIGYATAKKLSEDGAKVIITGRRKEAVKNAAVELFHPIIPLRKARRGGGYDLPGRRWPIGLTKKQPILVIFR